MTKILSMTSCLLQRDWPTQQLSGQGSRCLDKQVGCSRFDNFLQMTRNHKLIPCLGLQPVWQLFSNGCDIYERKFSKIVFFYRSSLGGNWGWKLEQTSERTRGNDASLPSWTSQHWTSNIPLENKGRTSPHYWAVPLCEAPPCATSRSTNTLLSFKVTTVAHHTCQRFCLLVVFYVSAYMYWVSRSFSCR